MGNVLAAMGLGAVSAGNAYMSLKNLLEYVNTKAIAVQEQIANAPELTQDLYQTAEKAAKNLGSGNLGIGVLEAGIAGACGAAAIYFACKKD